MDTLEDYTTANKLILNRDKTKFLVISRKQDTREALKLKAEPENIKPIQTFKFLGMIVSDDLKWNKTLLEGKLSLVSQLRKRTAALKKNCHYTNDKLFRKLTNGLFLSKLLYGAELWSGAPNYIIKKFKLK